MYELPKFYRRYKPTDSKAQQNPNRRNPKKYMPRHTEINF